MTAKKFLADETEHRDQKQMFDALVVACRDFMQYGAAKIMDEDSATAAALRHGIESEAHSYRVTMEKPTKIFTIELLRADGSRLIAFKTGSPIQERAQTH